MALDVITLAAAKKYTDTKVGSGGGSGSEIDLTEYAKIVYVDGKIAEVEKKIPTDADILAVVTTNFSKAEDSSNTF